MLRYSRRTPSQPEACSGAEYLTFDTFEKTGLVRHAFSTRIGGVSSGCFESMNLWQGSCNPNRKAIRDTIDNVKANFQIFSEAVGFDIRNTVLSDQVHGTELAYISSDDRGKGLITANDIKNADGLVTKHKNVVLTTFYADCVPLFFLDPVNRVIALSHAGWKGTLKRMAEITVQALTENYQSKAEHILCGIGPAIGGCCYEVDISVAEAFMEELPGCAEFIIKPSTGIELSRLSESGDAGPDSYSKYFLNLKQINRHILMKAGISEHNIEVSDLCTKCNPQLFYSHRGMGVERGQMAAVLELI